MSFPDAEKVFAELLEPVAPVYTPDPNGMGPEFIVDPADPGDPDIPEEHKVRPPFILVTQTGGNTGRLQKICTVEVEGFGVTEAATKAMNAAIEERLTNVVGIATQQGFVDRIRNSTAPTQVPFEAGPVRRNTSSWDMVARSQ